MRVEWEQLTSFCRKFETKVSIIFHCRFYNVTIWPQTEVRQGIRAVIPPEELIPISIPKVILPQNLQHIANCEGSLSIYN